MIFIFEGQDGTGKTTAIRNLKKLLTNPKIVTLATSSPPHVDNQYLWSAEHYTSIATLAVDLAVRENFDVVFDRFHFGEYVYAPKFRGYDAADIFMRTEELLSVVPVTIILLTASSAALAKRDDGFSNETNLADFDDTRTRFVQAQKASRFDVRHFDTSTNFLTIEDLKNVIGK
jgi:thymidylate kinase